MTVALLNTASDAGAAGRPLLNLSLLQTGLAALLAVPGGWVGDRILGWRLAILVGGLTMAAGTGVAAALPATTLYVGVVVAAIGAGLLHGNALALLDERYRDSTNRLSGFTWYDWSGSTGTLLGGALGTLLSTWRSGLGASAVALGGGLLFFLRTPSGGQPPQSSASETRMAFPPIGSVLVMAAFSVVALVTTRLSQALLLLFSVSAFAIVLLTVLPAVRRSAIAWLLVAAMSFWALFVATNSRMSSLLESMVQQPPFLRPRVLAMVQPLLIVVAGPLFAWLWRNARQAPHVTNLYATGFVLIACAYAAFFVNTASGSMAQFATIAFFSAVAVLLIRPAGTSALTRLAAPRTVATTAGAWSLASVLGTSGGGLLLRFPVPRQVDLLLLVTTPVAIAVALVVGRHSIFAFGADARDRRRWFGLETRAARFVGVVVSGLAAAVVVYAIWSATRPVEAAAPKRDTIVTRGAIDLYLPDDTMLGFVSIPTVEWTTGGASTQRSSNEVPVTTIQTGGVLLGKYEVTVAQYNLCVADGGCRADDPRATGGPPDWPVRHVTWSDAIDYCAWLRRRLPAVAAARTDAASLVRELSGASVISLPSEAEWEGAARFLAADSYPWGGPLTPLRANYASAGRTSPSTVGEFGDGANRFGVVDLSGNVAEWTRSEYRPYPYDPNDGREDTCRAATTRVIRGGSFYDGPTLLQTTSRQAADPAVGYDYVGFRVVITRAASVQPKK